MAIPAHDNGHEVRLVGTPLDREIIDTLQKTGHHKTLKRDMPAGVKFYQIDDLDKALEGTTLLIGGVSSFRCGLVLRRSAFQNPGGFTGHFDYQRPALCAGRKHYVVSGIYEKEERPEVKLKRYRRPVYQL